MHKYFLYSALICAIFATFVQAQSDISRFEVYTGYSNNQVDIKSGDRNNVGIDNFFDGRANFNGFEVAGTFNVSRFIAAKGDFTAHFKDFDDSNNRFGSRANSTNFNVRSELYNTLIGAQIKDNSNSGAKLKPFGHVLVGLVYGKNRTQEFNRTSFANNTFPRFLNKGDYGVGGAVGGGLDIRLGDRVDVRAIQVDYNPTRLFGETQHNVRFGAGFVFH